MKFLPKLLIGITTVGTVGYAGLNVAKLIPQGQAVINMIPIVRQIPTPIADSKNREALLEFCLKEHQNGELLFIGKSADGTYDVQERIAKNPNRSDEEYEQYKENKIRAFHQEGLSYEYIGVLLDKIARYELDDNEYHEYLLANAQQDCFNGPSSLLSPDDPLCKELTARAARDYEDTVRRQRAEECALYGGEPCEPWEPQS